MGGKSYTKNRVPSNRHVIECLSNVRRIIEYMQGFEWKEAPKTPVNRLIFPEDFPREKRKTITNMLNMCQILYMGASVGKST